MTSHNTPRHSHAEAAKTLLASASRGVVATLDRESGSPYASVIELLPTEEGEIVVFLSELAEHTKNFQADPRVSIVVAEEMAADRILALGRATFQGSIERVDDPAIFRDAYLARHPEAVTYIDFSDFAFYRITVERCRYIGGFGRMSWIDQASYAEAEVDPLVEAAPSVVAHMNDDHADNLLEYAHAFAHAFWATSARMVRMDRFGFDLRLDGDERSEEVRIAFEEPVTDPGELRTVMVDLAHRARIELQK